MCPSIISLHLGCCPILLRCYSISTNKCWYYIFFQFSACAFFKWCCTISPWFCCSILLCLQLSFIFHSVVSLHHFTKITVAVHLQHFLTTSLLFHSAQFLHNFTTSRLRPCIISWHLWLHFPLVAIPQVSISSTTLILKKKRKRKDAWAPFCANGLCCSISLCLHHFFTLGDCCILLSLNHFLKSGLLHHSIVSALFSHISVTISFHRVPAPFPHKYLLLHYTMFICHFTSGLCSNLLCFWKISLQLSVLDSVHSVLAPFHYIWFIAPFHCVTAPFLHHF